MDANDADRAGCGGPLLEALDDDEAVFPSMAPECRPPLAIAELGVRKDVAYGTGGGMGFAARNAVNLVMTKPFHSIMSTMRRLH